MTATAAKIKASNCLRSTTNILDYNEQIVHRGERDEPGVRKTLNSRYYHAEMGTPNSKNEAARPGFDAQRAVKAAFCETANYGVKTPGSRVR